MLENRCGDRELLESSPVQKDLGVLMDEKLVMIQQCVLEAQKTNCIRAASKEEVGSREKEVIVCLYSALVRPCLQYCILAWGPQ